MKTVIFAGRTAKEVLRDPLNIAFGLGFPVVLLLLLSAIQANIPVPLFEIPHLAPGMTVFGPAFLTLFSATLVAKDRESAFIQRLYTTPLTEGNMLVGYTLPLIPLALAQTAVTYLLALLLGLDFTWHLPLALLLNLPCALLFVALGLLCGSLLNVKQVGGLCGALLTNLTAWMSGIWFDLELVGGAFKRIAYCLPFVHAVELQRAAVAGCYEKILPHLLWVCGYAVVILALAILTFRLQKRKL